MRVGGVCLNRNMRANALRRLIPAGLVAASLVFCVGMPVAAEPDGRADDAVARVEAAARSKSHARIRTSIAVWDAESGDRIFSRGADKVLRPASVMKLATTGAALLAFGPEHELTTDVLVEWRSGRRGAVPASLVVRGGFDPGLSARDHDGDPEAALKELADQVVEAGISRVYGDLVLDDTAAVGARHHPSWGWKSGNYDWWMAPVSSLMLNDNCVDVTALPGPAVGAPAILRTSPTTGAARFHNRLTTVAKRKSHRIRFASADTEGRIPVLGGVLTHSTGYTASLACVDPVEYFGDVFRRVLAERGVRVDGRIVAMTRTPDAPAANRPPAARLERVARHVTSLGEAVDVANQRSQNLYAEALLRRLGQRRGSNGSFEGGCEAVRELLGFEDSDASFVQVDGCGLSRRNQASADAIGRILLALYQSEQRIPFMRSLARPGDAEGTLRKRFKQERFEGRVLAKTGTLRDTSALAGYVRTDGGRVLAFAVLCEGDVSRSRVLQDAVVDALVGRR
jgi:serine-type D-Ala-D-Ala carboxypeptidase/endopeptidase (penicillin-binding protein 4)